MERAGGLEMMKGEQVGAREGEIVGRHCVRASRREVHGCRVSKGHRGRVELNRGSERSSMMRFVDFCLAQHYSLRNHVETARHPDQVSAPSHRSSSKVDKRFDRADEERRKAL